MDNELHACCALVEAFRLRRPPPPPPNLALCCCGAGSCLGAGGGGVRALAGCGAGCCAPGCCDCTYSRFSSCGCTTNSLPSLGRLLLWLLNPHAVNLRQNQPLQAQPG